MINKYSDKLCGYEIVNIFKTDLNGIIYRAIEEKSRKPVLLRLVKTNSTTTSNFYSNKKSNDFVVDHEIIISNPPCPAKHDQTKTRDFPVFIDGEIFQFRLNPGVRKPGYWATTAIRVARNYMKKIPKNNLKILDLGCGCGVIGILLGLDPRVTQVVFSDINKEAIDSTTVNAERMGLKKYAILITDLFEGMIYHNQFDIIVFGPPFYPNIIPSDNRIADIGGPRGTEIAERYAKTVAGYLSPVGYSITYLADFVEYPRVLYELNKNRLITAIEKRDILYPFNPDHNFPQCNEILWKNKIESFFNYEFKEYTFCNRKFIGFKMLHFVSQLKV